MSYYVQRSADEIICEGDQLLTFDGTWKQVYGHQIGMMVGISRVRRVSDECLREMVCGSHLKPLSDNVCGPSTAIPEPDHLKALEAERGKVYGDPRKSHANIGLSWSGLIQQHYNITLDHPIPDYLVAQMMVAFKNQRSARVFKDDNYDDAAVYLNFARRFQQGKE